MQYLNEEIDENSIVRRIEVQCLDFDWIFDSETTEDGKERHNTLTLIDLLNNEAVSNKIYRQSSLRIFIQFLWSEYRPRII